MSGAIAATVAAVVNSILFFMFHEAGIITDDIFVQSGQPLTVVPVIISSILPTLVATLLFFLIEKYTQKGFKIFSIVATILFILFLAPPFIGIEGVTTGYALVMELMHLVVFVSLMFFLRKATKEVRVN